MSGAKKPMTPRRLASRYDVRSNKLKHNLLSRHLLGWALLGLLAWSARCHALSVVTGPVFTPATNAPLAGTLQLTTDEPCRVSVSVNDGQGSWGRNFEGYGTSHSEMLLGFKASSTNNITVVLYDLAGTPTTLSQPLVFVSPPVPADLPKSVVFKSDPLRMEPGYTLFRCQNLNTGHGYLQIVDSAGQTVWYSGVPTTSDVRQLASGDLFIPEVTNFVEINMLGDTVQSWPVPTGLNINLHDGVPTDHGTILYLSDASETLTNFPTSSTVSNAPTQTTSVLYNKVVEISATNAALLNVWSPIDILDPYRLTYLTFDIHTAQGWDIEHANAVLEDPTDHNLVVSMREQNLVFKFSRQTGQLMWLLGPPQGWKPAWQPYVLTPTGGPLSWNYGQHSPLFTPWGTLIVYDDGNYRAMPYDPPLADTNNYTRAVEYRIDEQNMTVSQVWDCGRTNEDVRIYTDRVGIAEPEPRTGNVLIDFGFIRDVDGQLPSKIAPNAIAFRIREVTHDAVPQVVFDESFFDYSNTLSTFRGYFSYRCHRIPDLYAVPTNGCVALTLNAALPSLPAGAVAVPYAQVLSASGGQPPYTFTVSEGTEPAGLSLSTDGHLEGTPEKAGTNMFTVTATDVNGCTGTQLVRVDILDALASLPIPRATFHGLVYNTNEVASVSSGDFTLSTTTNGHFSGVLRLHGERHGLVGWFDTNGVAQVRIPTQGPPRLHVALQLDLLSGYDHLRGTVSNAEWSASLVGDPALVAGPRRVAPQAGRYTLLIPGSPEDPDDPSGDGYGTVFVTQSGDVRLVGRLADGKRFSQTAALTTYGQWPLYAPLYRQKGLLLGWLTFTNDVVNALDLEGGLTWIKPKEHANYYANGFTVAPVARGSRWVAPNDSNKRFFPDSGALVLDGANLNTGLTNSFQLDTKSFSERSSSEHLDLTLSRESGRFEGSVLEGTNHLRLRFGGVVLQRAGSAAGFFLGTHQSGQVLLEP